MGGGFPNPQARCQGKREGSKTLPEPTIEAHLSASNRFSARLDALRALDAHVAQSTAHGVMPGLLAFAWFMFSAMAPVIVMDQLTSWLIRDGHWPLWLHWMTPLMAVGPGSVLVWLGPKLFSSPFVNLFFAAVWANVVAYLTCALPCLFADLA